MKLALTLLLTLMLCCNYVIAIAVAIIPTKLEAKWLSAYKPVLQANLLPVKVIVKTSPSVGVTPIGVTKDCKILLQMRNNKIADNLDAKLPDDIESTLIEAFFVHEIAHCYRFSTHQFYSIPSSLIDKNLPVKDDLDKLLKSIRETRREEGYADLVALIWTKQQHPEKYERVHAWFLEYRENNLFPGASHDTRTWIKIASNLNVDSSSIFEQAMPLWRTGLILPIE